MKLLRKWLWATCRAHPWRLLLASAGLAAASALLIAIVGGYEVALDGSGRLAGAAFGRYQVLLLGGQQQRSGMPGFAGSTWSTAPGQTAGQPAAAPGGRQRGAGGPPGRGMGGRSPGAPLPAAVLALLADDRLVAESLTGGAMEIELRNPLRPGYTPGHRIRTQMVATTAAQAPLPVAAGEWPQALAKGEAVISGRLAERMQFKLGGDITVTTTRMGAQSLRIGAILGGNPMAPDVLSLYVSPDRFAELAGQRAGSNLALLRLADGVTVDALRARLEAAAPGQRLTVLTPDDYRRDAEMGLRMSFSTGGGPGFGGNRLSLTSLAVISALALVFAVLSVGVTERTRQLAVLRCLGMTRRQCFALILGEGLLVGAVGLVLGSGLGLALLQLAVHRIPDLASGLVLPPAKTLLWALSLCLAGGLVAAVLPAILAARRHPLEGLAAMSPQLSRRQRTWLAAVGVLLALVQPALVLLPRGSGTTDLIRSALTPIAYGTSVLGYALLIPCLLPLVEGLLARPVAWVLRLEPRLLRQYLSSNLYGSLAATIAMTFGLGLFISTRIWGSSMLAPFLLTEKHPDVVVRFFPNGFSEDAYAAVRSLPGIKRALPLYGTMLNIPGETGAAPAAGPPGSNSRMYCLGGNIQALFAGDHPWLAATLPHGPRDAWQQLDREDVCLAISQLSIQQPERFAVGQTMTLAGLMPGSGEWRFPIAGIIDIPGWHLLTIRSQMRQGKTAGMIVVSEASFRRAFPQVLPSVVWLQLTPDADPQELEAAMADIARLDAENMGHYSGVAPTIAFTDVSLEQQQTRERAWGIIRGLTIVPLFAVGLAGVAVACAVLAAVRSRRWQFGVLRSVGLARSQLFRLILAEGLMLALVACGVSLVLGLQTALGGIYLTSRAMGVYSPYLIPWGALALGLAGTLLVGLLAALGPAWAIARAQPLSLLSEGRASF